MGNNMILKFKCLFGFHQWKLDSTGGHSGDGFEWECYKCSVCGKGHTRAWRV